MKPPEQRKKREKEKARILLTSSCRKEQKTYVTTSRNGGPPLLLPGRGVGGERCLSLAVAREGRVTSGMSHSFASNPSPPRRSRRQGKKIGAQKKEKVVLRAFFAEKRGRVFVRTARSLRWPSKRYLRSKVFVAVKKRRENSKVEVKSSSGNRSKFLDEGGGKRWRKTRQPFTNQRKGGMTVGAGVCDVYVSANFPRLRRCYKSKRKGEGSLEG